METHILALIAKDSTTIQCKHKQNALHSRRQYPLKKQVKKEGAAMTVPTGRPKHLGHHQQRECLQLMFGSPLGFEKAISLLNHGNSQHQILSDASAGLAVGVLVRASFET